MYSLRIAQFLNRVTKVVSRNRMFIIDVTVKELYFMS